MINISNIDISTENTYFLPGNMKVTNEEGMFLDEEGNTVDTNGNNITEENAANKFHPKFQNPVMEYEVEYETITSMSCGEFEDFAKENGYEFDMDTHKKLKEKI